MQLDRFFRQDLVILDQTFTTKSEALAFLASNLVAHDYARDDQHVLDLALQREAEFSTGIGNRIAIPHIRDAVMHESVISFAKVAPLEWQALDQQPVEFIFFISLTPADATSGHMEIIAKLSALFLEPTFVEQLATITNYQDLIALLNAFSTTPAAAPAAPEANPSAGGYDVVAVTACPTGIAHTFMARDLLLRAAAALNISIKVETQGADGTQNQLSQADINGAQAVLIAVDRTIDLSRFQGHPNFLEMGTKAVIKDAKKELERALNREGIQFQGAPRPGAATAVEEAAQISFDKFGKRMYKSLMTGVSYMLPFVIFGGILIALAFLIDIQNAGLGDYGQILPAAKWFKTLGGLAFGLMTSVLCAGITYAIVGRQGLLPGIVVGQIASGNFLMKLDASTGTISWVEPSAGGAVSGVFGAVIGAFLAASILIVLIKYVFAYLPAVLNGVKNVLLIPLIGTLIIATVFWIVNIPVVYLNYWFTLFLQTMEGKPYLAWLLGMILGAMMAVDLGGPINKAAYVFGTTSLGAVQGSGTISMAAAMAAGMVPPIAIALSTTFFKKQWTEEERKSGLINYIMGLTFISEGAIPFTVAKPKVMVPANIIGGAVTGLFIGAFGVAIAAPHGGILTIALAKSDMYGVISNSSVQIGLGISLFIAAIIVGSVAGMFAIFFLNKIFNRSTPSDQPPAAPAARALAPAVSARRTKVVKTFGNKSAFTTGPTHDLHHHVFAIHRLCYQ